MTVSLVYNDAYLAALVTEDREARALAYVDDIAEFPAEWRDRLAVAWAYVLAATESQRAPDDLFGTKAKAYRTQFNDMLPIARNAADAATGTTGAGSMLSIPWARA